jgi:serine O-acetyltransferase
MWSDLLADLRRYPRLHVALRARGFWAVALYRVEHALLALPKPLRVLVKTLLFPLAFFVRTASGVELPPATKVGPGLYIGHFGCIIVSRDATIGASCNLGPGVVIGRATKGGVQGAPIIGDRVYIGPGAKVFGPIVVGSDTAIGSNAVVDKSVPAGVSMAGVPARIVSNKGSRDLIDARDTDPADVSHPPAVSPWLGPS